MAIKANKEVRSAISKAISKGSKLTVSNVDVNTQTYVLQEVLSGTDKDVIFVTKDSIECQKVYNSLKFISDKEVLFFPEWDVAPYESVSPAQSLLTRRIDTLVEITQSSKQKCVVTTVKALLRRILTKETFLNRLLILKVGDVTRMEEVIKFLIDNGYSRSSFVTVHGEFSVRGGIIDIASEKSGYGYRLEFFGDEVETIKLFDISSQLTVESSEVVKIAPTSELILSDKTISSFENYLIGELGVSYKEHQLFANIHNQIKPAGIERFLPVFYKELGTLFDYLKGSIVVLDSFAEQEVERFLEKVGFIYKNKADMEGALLLSPERIWLSHEEMWSVLSTLPTISFSSYKRHDQEDNCIESNIKGIPSLHASSKSLNSSIYKLLKDFIGIQHEHNKNVVVSCLTEGSRDRIIKILKDHDTETFKTNVLMVEKFSKSVYVIVSPIEYGAVCENYCIITEEDLFGEKVKDNRSKQKKSIKNLISVDQSIQVGEILVHKDYGIGRFEGLELIKLTDTQHDCLKIIYAGDDKLFVPVENMDVVTKYGSSKDNVKLDKLGGASWQLRKATAKNKIGQIAEYLLKIEAQRHLIKGEVIESMPGLYEEFCATFPYVETEDQETTINAVIQDLSSGKPMNRLICGDTGFGKTEVAMRAAFVVAKASQERSQRKLIALICPTTLLCRQHYQVFKQRFRGLDMSVTQLSRFVSSSEKSNVIKRINAGDVDVVIGTHALLNDKIDYKNLALLIIDEEHHFGVAHKEKLKKLKENVHVLTLSATPIPRTLQMSLVGIRDLSLITTPPINRLATKISVMSLDSSVVKEALLREHHRNGQSFYICPRVHDLQEVEVFLKDLVPDLKVRKAHGKLPVSELDKIMNEFYEGKFDILLSTSIIESGLDIPKANTIIVHRANQFGLAQLYQLKGRVGRSNLASYAYFTVKKDRILSTLALKRLQVLQNLDELGAGFSLASYDMDIRGFGNLLGEEQAGHIREIGVELYQQMLEDKLNKIRNKEGIPHDASERSHDWVPQINIDMSVLIPEKYVQDFDLRLSLYKRIANLRDEGEVVSFSTELIDRFGAIPQEVEGLLSVIRLKQFCLCMKVKKVNLGAKGILIEFVECEDPKFSERLLGFIMKCAEQIKIKSSNEIILKAEIKEQDQRIIFVQKFLEKMQKVLNGAVEN